MRLLYGTGNPGKAEEMRRALVGLDVEVVSPAQLGIACPSVVENGKTLLENARLKSGCLVCPSNVG